MRRLWAAVRADRQGGAAIEFAIVCPVLVAILFGIIEMGRMFYIRQSLEYATEEAARYYAINPSLDTGSIDTALRSAMAGGMGSDVSIVYGAAPSCGTGATCTLITATYNFNPAGGFTWLKNQTLTAKAVAIRWN